MEERNGTWTKGPWHIVRYGDGSSLVIHSDADNRVCFMATASSDRPTSHAAIRANAALIAAAPSQNDALRKLAKAADYLITNYLADELEDQNLCTSVDQWAAIQLLNQTLETANAALLLANTGGTENG